MQAAATTAMRTIEHGGFFSVPGYRGAAVASGVKPDDALDLALIVADEPRAAAGVFTTNCCAAAPVETSRAVLAAHDQVRAVVINSGNANALTGDRGHHHAEAMHELVEEHCGGPAIVLSTGVIGVPLPIGDVMRGIDGAATRLERDADDDVARAMMTTDSHPKHTAVEVAVDDERTIVVGGVAKGSGMIHPRMATMLAVVATDAVIATDDLRAMLRDAVDASFNRISVDGDMSTNDAVIALATPPEVAGRTTTAAERRAVREGLTAVCQSLAEAIVADGEGVTRTMDIRVDGAPSEADAGAIAEAIARSTLVKTALTGGDPNWGRILGAAGTAAPDLHPETCTLRIGDQVVFADGEVQTTDAARCADAFARDRVHIALTVGHGPGRGRMLTADLSKRYVEINSEYTT